MMLWKMDWPALCWVAAAALSASNLAAEPAADNDRLLESVYGHIGYSHSFDENAQARGGISDLKSVDDNGSALNVGAVFNSGFSEYVRPYVEASYFDLGDRYFSLLGGGLRHDWQTDDRFTPYASVGLGYLSFRWDELPANGFESEYKGGNSAVVTAQTGVLWALTPSWALDVRARYDVYDITTTLVQNNQVTQIEDRSALSLLVGIQYRFGQTPVDGDDDLDGVLNSVDECPGTLPRIPVDERGCPRRYFSINLSFEFAEFKLARLIDRPDFPVLKFLNKHGDYHIFITGHTDSKGSAAFNQKLSEQRAAEARQFLIENGIEAQRITSSGRGESMPIADNREESGRLANRRITVEFFIPAQDDEE